MAVTAAGKTAYQTRFRSRIPSAWNRRRLENRAVSGFSRPSYTDTRCIKDNVLLDEPCGSGGLLVGQNNSEVIE